MNVFVNLPVADLARSRAFFAAIGFTFDERFCDDTALGMKISDTNFAMLLTHEKFAAFTPRKISDAHKTTEVSVALQLESRADVNRMTETAFASGAGHVREPEDHGFMYAQAFADLDGHIWEPFWMDTAQMPAKG